MKTKKGKAADMRNTTPHTPGPWRVAADLHKSDKPHRGSFDVLAFDEKGRLGATYKHVAMMPNGYFATLLTDAESEANARLIAAAPELLASTLEVARALKDIINAADNGEQYTPEELGKLFTDALGKAHKAIAAATDEDTANENA